MPKAAHLNWNAPRPMRRSWLLLHRLGRSCFWHDPAMYRWLGRLRGHGDCLNLDFDLWIDGFPGSAGNLAARAFQQANPAVRLAPRRHLPPFILNAAYNFKPGMLLISRPEDAVVSGAIISNTSLSECLDYYNDFHRLLRPNAPWLFVVTTEELVTQLARVIESFNLHYRTNYLAPDVVFPAAEAGAPPPAAVVGELRVSRPASGKRSLRRELRERLRETPSLRRKLERARQLYSAFVPRGSGIHVPSLDLTTRHLPTLA
jgi:hypothetical protein